MKKSNLNNELMHLAVARGDLGRLESEIERIRESVSDVNLVADCYLAYHGISTLAGMRVDELMNKAIEDLRSGWGSPVSAMLLHRLLFWLESRGVSRPGHIDEKLTNAFDNNPVELWLSLLDDKDLSFPGELAATISRVDTPAPVAVAPHEFNAELHHRQFCPAYIVQDLQKLRRWKISAMDSDVLFPPLELGLLAMDAHRLSNDRFRIHGHETAVLFDPITFWTALSRLAGEMARLGRNTAVVISTREIAYEIVVRNQEDQLASRGASFDLGELAFSYVSQLAPAPIDWWGSREELVTGFAERRLAGYVRDRERAKPPESSVTERSFADGQSGDE